MPVNPSTWVADQEITASQLNADLYTFLAGNNHYPNGILFHSTPPMLLDNLAASTAGSQPSSSAGSTNNLLLTPPVPYPTGWRASVDNSLIFGQGAEYTGSVAIGQFLATVNGSSGAVPPYAPGGNYLFWGVASFAATANAGGSGALLYQSSSPFSSGGMQRSSTNEPNAAYVLDLVQSVPPAIMSLGGYCADTGSGSFAYNFNTADYTGPTCLMSALWAGTSAGSGSVVPSSLPVPVTGYTDFTRITADTLNGNGLAAPLAFLNNPPQLRIASALTTSIPNSATPAPTLVPLGTGIWIDNWSRWNSTTSTYTAPVSGVYLVHGTASFAASTGGSRVAGIQINGGTVLWGPGHQAAGTGRTMPQVVRLVDLNAGDTVTLVTAQNSGAALALSSAASCRLVLKWMAALALSSGSVAWTPPVTGFRWQAGTPVGQLTDLFNAHLANDLSFLIQRPYLMSYQSVAQTGLARNAFRLITMDQPSGRIHASAGDNYGGWTGGAANKYAAVVPGWYLAVATYIEAAPAAASTCLAGIGYFTSAGAAQGSSPQLQGQQVSNASANYAAGAEAIGLFYLRTGDYLQPWYQQQNGPATFATSVAITGQESSFSCVWVSE
jgi:hypothetical protein